MRIAIWVVAAAAVSLAVSALVEAAGSGRHDGLVLLEAAAMIVLIFLVVRRASARQAIGAGLAAAVAETVMILSEAPPGDSLRDTAGAVALWSLGALGAAGAALHLNSLDRRRAESIAQARRAQRLELAQDLHDFVAHDVSGMVVQAQAGQVAGVREPGQALAALERIEEDGLRALSAMDRTVQALRDVDGRPGAPAPVRTHDLHDLAELTDRFAAGRSTQVRLDVGPGALRDLPPEVTTTGYRVAVEALTNVRRHAPAATRVDVEVSRPHTGAGQALALTVTNDGVAAARPDRALRQAAGDGGHGLAGLRERVEALGGALSTGPEERDGWRLRMVLPLAGAGAGRP